MLSLHSQICRAKFIDNEKELKKCYDLTVRSYESIEDGFVKADREFFWNNMITSARSGACMISLYKDETLIGWMMALEGRPFMHSKDRVLSQNYFHSEATGRTAVEAILRGHRLMLDEAKRRRLPWAMSSSYLDTNKTFLRILEKDGWTIRGGIAMKKTN
jgi:hypothetical protein